jgi:hypothetical protein
LASWAFADVEDAFVAAATNATARAKHLMRILR